MVAKPAGSGRRSALLGTGKGKDRGGRVSSRQEPSGVVSNSAAMSAAIDDRELAERAGKGDAVALEELSRRHGPAAWRLAQVVTRRHDALAASAAATALATTFGPAGPDAGSTVPAGELLAAVREAGLSELRAAGEDHAPADATAGAPPAVRALLAMPERWRSLLWLLEVEEVPVEVAAAALRLAPPAAERLAAKVRAGFRERALAAAAADALADRPGRSGGACHRALTAAAAVADHRDAPAPTPGHVRRCASCRAAVAAASSPADDLAPWVAPLPATLAGTAQRRWAEVVGDAAPAAAAIPATPRRGLPAWARRAVSGGCAALLLVGITSAMSVGGDPLRSPVFGSAAGASPFAAAPFEEAASGGRSLGDLPRYELARGVAFQGAPAAAGTSSSPRYTSGTAVARTAPSGGPDGAPSTGGAPAGSPPAGSPGPGTPGGGGTPAPDPGDGGGGGPSPSTPPPTSPPPTSPPPTSPPPTSPPPTVPPPTTPPPPGGGGGGDDDDSTTIGNDDVTIGVGDCTGAEVGGVVIGCDPGEEEGPDVTVPPIGLP